MADVLTAEVVAVLNERAADAAARRLVTQFANAGKASGTEFEKAFEAEVAKTNLAADRIGSALQQRLTDHGSRSARGFGSAFGSELAQSLPGVSGFASAMSGYDGAAGKVGAVAGRALGLAFTTAAAGIIGAAGFTLFKGFERYQSIDAAKNRLDNLNLVLEKTGRQTLDVGRVMDTVNKVVDQTRFSLSDAFAVSTSALSSPTGDLERFMTAVADAAEFTGGSIGDVGQAFIKIANQGKVSMGELTNELVRLPVQDWLARTMGKSTDEITKMISESKIGLEQLLTAVEFGASGLAKGGVNSLEGAMEQLNTAVSRLGANTLSAMFGQPTDEANSLTEAVNAFAKRINDVNKWVVAHQDDIKNYLDQGVAAAQNLATAIGWVVDRIDDIPGGLTTVVGAFAAWKALTIGQGAIAAVNTSLTGVNTMLRTTLPASAAAGAASITAALGPVAALIAGMWAIDAPDRLNPNDPRNIQERAEQGDWGSVLLGDAWPWIRQQLGLDRPPDGTSGGGGSFATPGNGMPALPGFGLRWDPQRGWVPDDGSGPAPAGSPILPPPGADGSSGPRLPDAPVVPYAELPPIDPRLQMTASLFSAQTSVADAATRLAEKEARVNQLRATNTATQDDILNAENEAAKARREKQEADMRFAEAQKNAFEQQYKQLKGASSALEEFGAALDSDFGISKGLAGIVENMVRLIGNIAAAPALAALGAVSAARGDEGSGLMGILASTGALGSQFMPTASNLGPAAFLPGMSTAAFAGGAYPGDAALLANVPAGRYAQVQNADLTQGLADCSSAVEDLVNILDGRPTGGRSMSTHNAAEWLTERGFLPGSMPGAFNVGFNASHMQATLPGGTPFNWGSDAAAANRGIGGTGAFDPAFTQHFFRPVGAPAVAVTPPAASGPGVAAPAGTSPGASSPGWVPILPPDITGGRGESPVFGAGPTAPAPGAGAIGTLAGSGALSGARPQTGPGAGLPGQSFPAMGGEGGVGVGGMAMDALMAGTSGLDMLAPGAGAAAKIGIQVINRSIKYAGQMAGIATNFWLSALTPAGENPKASIGNSWFGKLIGGIAGAKPALPNLAGGKPPGPMGQEGQQGQQPGQPVTNNLTINNNHATEDFTGNQAVRELGEMYAPAGRQ